MGIVGCHNCGARVSDTVAICPQCHKPIKAGRCQVCLKEMKASKVWAFRNLSSHERCLAILFNRDGRCWECGRLIWLASTWWGRYGNWGSMLGREGGIPTCHDCGVEDPLKRQGMCAACNLPIYAELHEVSEGPNPSKHAYCVSLNRDSSTQGTNPLAP